MSSLIQNRIGVVFIPVSDIVQASEWYRQLFGLPPQETTHDGTIYTLPMQGEVGLILDATPKPVTNSSQPLCFFWTSQLPQVYEWLKQHNVEIVSEIEDIGSVQTLTFKDLDKNLIMVCQKSE